MTLRVVLMTSGPVGGAGAVLDRLTRMPEVEIACLIVSETIVAKRSRKKMLQKVWKIGLLGALNGVRIRKWFGHNMTIDAREVAKAHGIPIVTVPRVNCDETVAALRQYAPDLGISTGNSYIASRVFTVPREGFINFHGELLPEYPGAQSVIWPIYFGRTQTGYTIHRIDKGIDTGDVLYKRAVDIDFQPKLADTIRRTNDKVREELPEAFAALLSDWDAHAAAATSQKAERHFTTPTFREYLRIERNNKRLWRESLRGS
ncbi:formyltransferase family protein [Sphingopyxis sp. PET50]|uniref:formyltransferase family protein n=1 Tax=Sphingopyxis sp. PET50 TaxID=2976533 RepID=UPI0021AEB6AF|nr:formyltransferase family protein [Sphingopyxis sp. PET50]